jgi:putative hydrolase of HD superfamily
MEKTQSYEKLRKWAYEEWRLMIENFEGKFQKTFLAYHSESHQNVNRKILSAAHILATKWEYGVLEKFNYQDYEKTEIEKRLKKEYEKYEDLHGIKILEAEKGGNELYDQEIEKHGPLTRLINLCGQLRFQLRWAHIHRIPKTSVLGHLLFVAIISYLISIESKRGTEKYCREGRFNNFFTGLFHDLPEVLTRDIVSPVKQSIEGLDEIIKKEEKEEMEQKIIMLFPDLVNSNWKNEMRLFTGILDSLEPNKTIEEFDNVYYIKGAYTNLKTDDIPTEYAADEYKPRDGRIVKDADKLAAFIEALVAIENGCSSRALYEAQHNIKPKYNKNERAEEKPNTQGAAFDVMREIYTEF